MIVFVFFCETSRLKGFEILGKVLREGKFEKYVFLQQTSTKYIQKLPKYNFITFWAISKVNISQKESQIVP